ncbi:MAG TPA: hypothetical protein VM012_00495 [Flavitalea sp.]|nr:hypothetical protein [Flavitalea sp.]
MKNKLTIKYIAFTLLAVVLTFLIHEFTHWTVGELLGYEMIMTLNTAYPAKLSYDQNWHYTFISAAGPLITLVQAYTVYLIIKKTSHINWFPFLFSCFYVELLSGIMNYRNPNDLGRISRTFHLGLFTLPLIFIFLHFILVYKTSVRQKYTKKFVLVTIFWILLFSSLWILINQRMNVLLIK